MKNNERNSRKRLNSLILLVAFTAVMLIVSTYAWFSTQKNVTLDGLQGVVNVAEGLQMSLDAKHWVNTINFDDFNQTSKTNWTVKDTATTTYLDSGKSFQAPADNVTNITPKEFFPVSTTGYEGTDDGIGQEGIKFYKGTNEETIKLLSDIAVPTENADAGYFAFDLFLMNTSAASATEDELLLDPVSDVVGGQETTGVQNTARVAFALYENNNDADDFDPDTAPAGTDMTIAGDNALTQAQIIEGTSGSSTKKTIKDIAIWEPNANQHADAIVNSLANTLKLEAHDISKWSLAAADANTKISKFTATQKLPTYALTKESLAANDATDPKKVAIADVYDWRTITESVTTDATGVKKQITLQTDAYESGSAAVLRTDSENLVSVKKWETLLGTDPDATTLEDEKFVITPNQYQKIRVYVWMEGQDPDCINSASLGGGLTIDIGFSKPGTASSASASV